jgi:hypothetical protein
MTPHGEMKPSLICSRKSWALSKPNLICAANAAAFANCHGTFDGPFFRRRLAVCEEV